MTKQQIGVVAGAIALFFVLYFGCDTKSRKQRTEISSSQQSLAATDPNTILQMALKSLSPAQLSEIQSLEAAAKAAATASQQADALKKWSGAYHRFGQEAAAACIAERVAEVEKTEQAWATAGGNFFLALRQSQETMIRDFCRQRAVAAFQNAASLNPTKLEHKIDMALCYAEHPLADEPMKGILMLRELDAAHPEHTGVNLQLARLAIKTGQFDKAIVRLEKVLAREPNLPQANCLAADAYSGAGDATKAAAAAKKCPK